MKVIAINGSPKPEGNTGLALQTVLNEIKNEGIDTEIVTIGGNLIHGCTGCCRCLESKNGQCIAFPNDAVNELLPKLIEADGIVLGSPTYFSGINGTLKSFLDRAFFVSWVNGGLLRLKIAGSIVSLRRGGGTCAFDELNKYFQISEMTVASSCYWHAVHGFAPGEMHQDIEGVQIARILGRNLAYLLKLQEYGRKNVPLPEKEDAVMMNFIR
ncbi:MAG: flavodoxin family protein [Planctomycetaceae bacterium]|jgi:multimeric flavodoxin WrbA|nr:flavodoxin family protein [Planctomycetaceae bacterium]